MKGQMTHTKDEALKLALDALGGIARAIEAAPGITKG